MSKVIVHNVPNCQYGGLWWGPLARKLDMGFVDDKSYSGCPSYTTDETIALVNDGKAKLLLYWRWPMPELPGRQYVYNRQQYLLQACDPNQIVVLDGDHELDLQQLDKRVKVLWPELELPLDKGRAMYPYLPELEQTYLFDEGQPLVYVGTPTGRLDQLQYLTHTPTELYGSWPKSAEYKLWQLMGKLPHNQVLSKYSGRVSFLFAKPSYYRAGYITPRWYELAYANCAAIIPAEFKQWVAGTELEQYVAHDAEDVSKLYRLLSLDQQAHQTNVKALRSWCKSIQGLAQWQVILV